MRTVHVLALVALLTSLGLAALDDLIALTVRTEHRNKHHHDLLHERGQYGIPDSQSANLKHHHALEYTPSGELYQGSAIRQERKAKGIGLRQLAALIPYDAGALSKVENNRAIAPSEILEKIAKILGVDAEDLADKPRHTRLSKPTTEAIEQHITADGKRAFEELKAEVQGPKADMAEVKAIIKDLHFYLRPDVEDDEIQRVKRVIAAVGRGNVEAALRKFAANPRIALYQNWHQGGDAEDWSDTIRSTEQKKGSLYLLMKGFSDTTVPPEQYEYQLKEIQNLGGWRADIIDNTIKNNKKRLDTVAGMLSQGEPMRARCNAWVVRSRFSARDSRIMSRAIRPSKLAWLRTR